MVDCLFSYTMSDNQVKPEATPVEPVADQATEATQAEEAEQPQQPQSESIFAA